MGNPKKRFSQARRNKRAAQWKLEAPNLEDCPRCHSKKQPHHACPNCGYYKDRQVLQLDEA